MKSFLIFFVFIFSFSVFAETDSLVKIELEGVSSSNSSFKAKKEIQEKLISELGEKLVRQLIGPEEYEKKKPSIDRAVKSQFGKFIPYMKAGQLRSTGKSYKQSIQFEVSLNSLREVLSQEGLLYEKVKNVKVLPVIGYLDSFAAKSYKWWYSKAPETNSFLGRVSFKTSQQLREQFWEEGFYVHDPEAIGAQVFLSEDFKVEAHRRQDLVALGKDQDADLVVYGGVRIGPSDENSRVSLVKLSLKAILVRNQRNVAEVDYSWNTNAGDYQEKVTLEYSKNLKEAISDLRSQVIDAYQKGKFGTQSMEMVLLGDLSYKDFESLKQSIRLSNYQIKSLKERRMASGEFTLELDVSGEKAQLVEHFKNLELNSWKLSLVDRAEDKIEVKVIRK
jgi:hypothetical protein